MTAILIDVFEDKIRVFADGRLAAGHRILTDSFNKVREITCKDSSKVILVGCGDGALFDLLTEAIKSDTLNMQKIRNITLDGVFFVIKEDSITSIELFERNNKDSTSKNGTITFDIEALPLFEGSGGEALSGAYNTLSVDKSKDLHTYIENVRKCFDQGCSGITSVGKLYSYKAMKIKKGSQT